ncbi:LysM peptidoglycan-binding domain-containing protein [Desulfonatronovibrio hydrogenovorans]|uniref:LysM peptidoglycan-binding domain-containing protein n=1 Tax=Desulfonatronovibrio hydrogenovorans TaxID=53245 RepID=UPI00048A6398|nr:LysM domain-containing protein [Desulfonatronovibrio hydrogenovorans]
MERKNWINKLDELEGDKPAPPKQKKNMSFNFGSGQENMLKYVLAGAGVVMVILLISLIARGGRDSSPAGMDEVMTRLEGIERQMGRMEGQEEERQRIISQVVMSSQDLRTDLETQRENLDDLRQKIAELEKVRQQPAPRPAPAPAPAPARQDQPGAEDRIVHEVQPGDNLFRIGLQYNISVDRLRQLNNLSPNDSIYPGQKLVVGTKN